MKTVGVAPGDGRFIAVGSAGTGVTVKLSSAETDGLCTVYPIKDARPSARSCTTFCRVNQHHNSREPAVAIAVDPLDVVHRAPVEVALDRHSVGDGRVLPQHAVAQVRDASGS